MEYHYLVVYVTVPSHEVGEGIARALLQQHLIACANLIAPVQSLYTWKGDLNVDEEVLMVLKTRAELFQDRLVPSIQALHPYEVPEIIAVPVLMGAPAYLEWIDEVTEE